MFAPKLKSHKDIKNTFPITFLFYFLRKLLRRDQSPYFSMPTSSIS